MLISFDTILERDRRTDGQNCYIDNTRQHYYAHAI